jgi:hypothetical protein
MLRKTVFGTRSTADVHVSIPDVLLSLDICHVPP